MNDKISSIWFKIASRGVKTLNIGAVYREHTSLNQDIITNSEPQQFERWNNCVEQWHKASRKGDCIIIGDTNLDDLRWLRPDNINLNMTNLIDSTGHWTYLVQGKSM